MKKFILIIIAVIFFIILMFSATNVNSKLSADREYDNMLKTLVFEPVYIPRPNDHPDLKIPYAVTATPTPKPTPKATPKPKHAVVKPKVKAKPKIVQHVVRVTSTIRFRWPVRGHLSGYYRAGHPAIDIFAPTGTRVKASAAGKIIFAGWRNNGGGYQVWISHGRNFYTTYNHLSSILTRTGKWTCSGCIIGRVGSTGWSTGPHLHFEIWRGHIWNGGYRVNPLRYL